MKIRGKVTVVGQIKSGVSQNSGNQWQSQDFVVEYQNKNDKYPKHACLNAYGDKVNQFSLVVGMAGTFYFDIDAREYNGKWYNTLSCYRVGSVDDDDQNSAGMAMPVQPQQIQQPVQNVQQTQQVQQPQQPFQGSQQYQQADQLYRGQSYQQTPNGGGSNNEGLPF